jgi:hypothetical protein
MDAQAYPSVTNDVGAFLRNHANGQAQGTNAGSVSSTHCVSPLLLQAARDTKLLPVVRLRSGVILLMGARTRLLMGDPAVARCGDLSCAGILDAERGSPISLPIVES